MRIILTLMVCFLIQEYTSAQSDTVGVFIPKDDGSQVNWQTKHMWVGQTNPIASNYAGGYKFIKVWTDNGVVDSGDFYFSNYIVTPEKEGPVTVYTIQSIWKGKQYDTIFTATTFTAIPYPPLSIRINDNHFEIDSILELEIIDNQTGQPADSKYEIGRMYIPLVYDSEGKLIGYPNEYFTNLIDLTYNKTGKLKIKNGQTLKLRILIRDTETDLLITTEEVSYCIR